MTVLALLLDAPEGNLETMKGALRLTAAGDWKGAARLLALAADSGATEWHDGCQALAAEFYAK